VRHLCAPGELDLGIQSVIGHEQDLAQFQPRGSVAGSHTDRILDVDERQADISIGDRLSASASSLSTDTAPAGLPVCRMPAGRRKKPARMRTGCPQMRTPRAAMRRHLLELKQCHPSIFFFPVRVRAQKYGRLMPKGPSSLETFHSTAQVSRPKAVLWILGSSFRNFKSDGDRVTGEPN
jgi:hypothetical protein